MSWFNKLFPSKINTERESRSNSSIPEGLWDKCAECKAVLYRAELERNLQVCDKCNFHMPQGSRARVEALLDQGSLEELATNVAPQDILKFRDSKKYRDRLFAAQKKTQEKDALLVFTGTLDKMPVVVTVFDFAFIGGSMGTVVGEKFVQACEYAYQHKLPLISFASSGGARMQEGLFSLMQMARTSAALKRLANANLPYFSILVNPTFGGVSASLAMLGDFNIAEPGALIGFAGPRVIEQTVREVLPEGFQTSDFLLEHGFIDAIVDRRELKNWLTSMLHKILHFKHDAN